MKLLSEKLRARRLELGYSIAEVAEAIGVNEIVIMRYEDKNIKKRIAPKLISQLTRVLKCTPSDIIDWEANEEETPSKAKVDRNFIRFYDNSVYYLSTLPKEVQENLRKEIEQLLNDYPAEN